MAPEWVGRISYKATWTLSVDESFEPGRTRITVGYKGANSTGPGERIVSHCRVIPEPFTFSDFVRECIVTFQELEHHEIREWFRVDGEHWPDFLPHDPGAIMEPLRSTGARYDELA